jgi:hypothetical protein
MTRVLFAAATAAVLVLTGCAAPAVAPGTAPSEGVVHVYRTGSILAQKEKRVTTEEERERAKEIAAEIRASPSTIVGRP